MFFFSFFFRLVHDILVACLRIMSVCMWWYDSISVVTFVIYTRIYINAFLGNNQHWENSSTQCSLTLWCSMPLRIRCSNIRYVVSFVYYKQSNTSCALNFRRKIKQQPEEHQYRYARFQFQSSTFLNIIRRACECVRVFFSSSFYIKCWFGLSIALSVHRKSIIVRRFVKRTFFIIPVRNLILKVHFEVKKWSNELIASVNTIVRVANSLSEAFKISTEKRGEFFFIGLVVVVVVVFIADCCCMAFSLFSICCFGSFFHLTFIFCVCFAFIIFIVFRLLLLLLADTL